MVQFRMHYLLLSSCIILLPGCSPVYKKMQETNGNISELQKFKPAFATALYKTSVDVAGNHLSGLLLIKHLPDSTTRIVFSNEMGFTFFDFEFSPGGDFKVYSIIKQMNKKPVISTLRHDFELILMKNIEKGPLSMRTQNGLNYYVIPQAKGYHYYITDSSRNNLIRAERASKTKTVAEAVMQNYINGIPDTIRISHHTFNFVIGLKRIER